MYITESALQKPQVSRIYYILRFLGVKEITVTWYQFYLLFVVNRNQKVIGFGQDQKFNGR